MNERISAKGPNRAKETREFQQKDQSAGQKLETWSRRIGGAIRWKETTDFQQKARKSKPQTREFQNKEHTIRFSAEILESLSSGMLLVLKFFDFFRAVCCFC